MKPIMKFWFLVFGALMLANAAIAESPREQLKQMAAQLQKSPTDYALREKIIKLARGLKPAPVIPEEARRSFVRGNTAFSEAKGQDDYARAVQRYEEALLIAPWWGDPYFNLAKAQEMRQDYGRAIQSLKFFVLTGPSADDARKAQDYSYVLEDKQEKLTKEKSEQEAAARAEEAKFGWLLGRWSFVMNGSGNSTEDGFILAKKEGNQVEFKLIQGTLHHGGKDYPFSVDYAEASGFIRGTVSPSGKIVWEGRSDETPGCPVSWSPINLVISSDRHTIEYAQNRRFYGTCAPSGQDPYTLTHE
jgi:tetratricopeptide (TPR) repeat protein